MKTLHSCYFANSSFFSILRYGHVFNTNLQQFYCMTCLIKDVFIVKLLECFYSWISSPSLLCSSLTILSFLFFFFTVNKHKPWIETTYHGIVTENDDKVLLDPPLIALDKDAPLRYAGNRRLLASLSCLNLLSVVITFLRADSVA